MGAMQLNGRDMMCATKNGLLKVASRRGNVGRRPCLVKAIAQPSQSVPFSSESGHLEGWSADSWKNYKALQQPNYPNKVWGCGHCCCRGKGRGLGGE